MQRISRDGLQAPALVVDWDLSVRSPNDIISVDKYKSVWALVRNSSIPIEISFWDVDNDTNVSLRDLYQPTGHEDPSSLSHPSEPDEPTPSGGWRSSDSLTVVVCTRDRETALVRLLESLRLQSDLSFELLVIHSAPRGTSLEALLGSYADLRPRNVVQPAAGLSRARNTALDRLETSHVAWIDDDERADPQWVAMIKCGFAHSSRPAAVCGLMLPAELVANAQVRFEQFDGFNKGKPLVPTVLTRARVNPLYPVPGFGAGGNMAFRTDALRAIGGFDPYLGAGTRTHGGEETRALSSLLARGERVLHWPSAITWHYHRVEDAALERQIYGYSAGLAAFYISSLLDGRRAIVDFLRLFSPGGPGVVHDVLRHQRAAKRFPDTFPTRLVRLSHKGLLSGGPSYALEAVADHRKRSQRSRRPAGLGT